MQHGYVTYGHVCYAKFGYAIWLRYIRNSVTPHHSVTPRHSSRHSVSLPLCQMVTPCTVTRVSPNSVTPHRYATYGYATCLCHLWSCWLRQIRLCHMVTPCTITPVMPSVTPNTVTPHSYATCAYAGYAMVTPNLVTPHGYATYGDAGYAIGYAKHGYAT